MRRFRLLDGVLRRRFLSVGLSWNNWSYASPNSRALKDSLLSRLCGVTGIVRSGVTGGLEVGESCGLSGTSAWLEAAGVCNSGRIKKKLHVSRAHSYAICNEPSTRKVVSMAPFPRTLVF